MDCLDAGVTALKRAFRRWRCAYLPNESNWPAFRGVILIVTLHPIHDLDFIAAFRGDIEVDENCVHLLVTAGIA